MPKWAFNLSLSIICLLIVCLLCYLINPNLINSDAFFHFAISKEYINFGLFEKLVQVDDLPWKKIFVDKEFLYHVLTSIVYVLAKEEGLKFLTLILAFAISINVIIIGLKLKPHSKIDYIFGIICLLFFSQILFQYRLFAIRPHLLSIFLFLINVYGILFHRKTLIYVSLFLFPLSYHFIPVIIFNIFAYVFVYKIKDRENLGILGLCLLSGIVLHPHFPGNLVIFWQHLIVAFKSSEVYYLDIASEFKRIPFSEHPSYYLSILFTYFICFFKKDFILKNKKSLFLAIVFIFWSLISFINQRSVEYMYVAMILFWFSISENLNKNVISFLGVICLLNLYYFFNNSFMRNNESRVYTINSYVKVLSFLPDEKDKKVFNCRWDTGQYVLNHNRDYKFVDLLEPRLLLDESKEKYMIRLSLNLGNIPDPYYIISSVFNSDYVFCNQGDLNLQMQNDPRFIQLSTYQPSYSVSTVKNALSTTEPMIFSLDESMNSKFLKNIKINGKYVTLSDPVVDSARYKNYMINNCLNIEIADDADFLVLGGNWIPNNSEKMNFLDENYNGIMNGIVKLDKPID